MLRFECIKELEEAKQLWKMLSPHQTIFDDWNLRYCFYKYFKHELFFYTGYEGDKIIGTLPLQYNSEKKCLEFFGGSYMEDNRVLITKGKECYISDFYQQINQVACLEYIRGTDSFTTSLPIQDYEYVLPLENITVHEDYFSKYLDSETRGKMRRKIRKVEKEGIGIVKNNFIDIELLFELNMINFGERSSFVRRPFLKEIFRDLLNLPFEVFLFTFQSKGKKIGVSLALLYNGIYEYFNLGVDQSVPGLSTYVTIQNLEAAITAKAYLFDAFTSDYGWKEHWHLSKIPAHKFEKIT